MNADADTRARLQRLVAGQSTLQQVARWAFGATPPLTMVNVVDQDEFNRDVVIELPASCELVGPGGPRLFLVYDCT